MRNVLRPILLFHLVILLSARFPAFMRAVMLEQQPEDPRTVIHVVILRLPEFGVSFQLFPAFWAIRVPLFHFRLVIVPTNLP
jgi:hypothetical protein